MTSERGILSPVRKLVISEVLIVLVIALSVVTYKALDARKPQVQRKAVETLGLNVDVYSATAIDLQELLTGFGTAQADREVILAAQVTGEIVEINPQLKVGYAVTAEELLTSASRPSRRQKAEVLLKIDPREYQQRLEQTASRIAETETEIPRLEVQLTNVSRQRKMATAVLATLKEEYDRIERAVKLNAASPSDLNRALLDLQRYEDTVIQLESQIASIPHQIAAAQQRLLTAQSEHRRAEDDLGKTEIRPPFSGVLSEVMVEQGQYVRAGEPLVRLTNRSEVEVPISLSFDDFLQLDKVLSAGRKPPVSLAENETADPRWNGFVVRASPEADTVSRTVQVFVEIRNSAEASPLLPGAFVHARIDGSIYRNAILVPREAIVDGQVYIVDKQNVARRRRIKSGRRLQSLVIAEDGLKPGDRVVMTNLDIIEDGRAVVVQSVRSAGDEIAAIRSAEIRLLTPVAP